MAIPYSSTTLFTASQFQLSQKSLSHTKSITKCCEIREQVLKFNNNNGFSETSLLHHSAALKSPRPRRIILVRHGESEGNVDESTYTRVADPKIELTEKGKIDAEQCGETIRELISKDGATDWKVYFYVSPYKRTRQTLQHLGRAFERSRIAGLREEPRLREQDFGNFQDREKMRVEKAIRNRYGRFFYRFPNGESAADVYDRITGFRETLKSDIDVGRFQPPGERNPEMNLVIVSHGLTLRVFLMRWYKWTVEQFERLNNLGNGKIIVMGKGYGGRYSLLVHHTKEELKEFGLTEEMLIDQEWQKMAKIGELNYDCPTMKSFFPHFEAEECETLYHGEIY
ncbi:Phosphoglycerate mutase family protein [Tripterygium wilfordii]|uniref:Phosphoglycerate mutase family protein n=1 Tax=Tripterygium wilfordii TaxID=458696 RepID=A0A7J7CL83_TRIWF|nr:phosphoglycerate mutase-like protein AT74H [Tripterygium wilfordii]KAF5734799.1 Phosphoglycerate mutase family protein [Tripterygium wilfordii]